MAESSKSDSIKRTSLCKKCDQHFGVRDTLDKHEVFHSEHFESNKEMSGRISSLSESVSVRIAESVSYTDKLMSEKSESCHKERDRMQEYLVGEISNETKSRLSSLQRVNKELELKIDTSQKELELKIDTSQKGNDQRLNDFKHFLITVTLSGAVMLSSICIAVGTGLIKMYGKQSELSTELSAVKGQQVRNMNSCDTEFHQIENKFEIFKNLNEDRHQKLSDKINGGG